MNQYKELANNCEYEKEKGAKSFFSLKTKEGRWNPYSQSQQITVAIYQIVNDKPTFIGEIKYSSREFPIGSEGVVNSTYHFLKNNGMIPDFGPRYNWALVEKAGYFIH